MATDYNVTINEEELEEMRRRLEIWGGNTDLVLSRAINSTANKARSSRSLPGGKKGASQQIIGRYDVKAMKAADPDFSGGTDAQYIKSVLKIFGANRARLTGKVYARKRTPLLSVFATNSSDMKNAPIVNVQKGTGNKAVGNIPQTRRDVAPFYTRNKQTGQLLIIGVRDAPGPRGGRTRAARTIGVGQMFQWIKDDMQSEIQEEFEKQVTSKMKELLVKLQVPMEDPGDE